LRLINTLFHEVAGEQSIHLQSNKIFGTIF
jgi:hypothetical protein